MNKEDLVPGTLYIIKDSFFKKVKDPYLMSNRKGKRIRPAVFLFIEISNGLALKAPVTSKAKKYDSIIRKLNGELDNTNDENKRVEINNKLLGFVKSNINRVSGYILLQDMFVVNVNYIKKEYLGFDGGTISLSVGETKNLVIQARMVYDLLRSGFKFMPTQPDLVRIEEIMKKEN